MHNYHSEVTDFTNIVSSQALIKVAMYFIMKIGICNCICTFCVHICVPVVNVWHHIMHCTYVRICEWKNIDYGKGRITDYT